MNLSKYIAELLVKNNCVIVPNFGGFIANYNPAIIDELRHKIYPPSKGVLFNSNLLNNDGLLANYVSTQISKTYVEALGLIDEVSDEWKIQLGKGERVSIGEVGFLYEIDNKIQFEQDREFNLLLGAYGLSTVHFLAAVKEQIIEEVETVDSKEELNIEFGQAIGAKVISENKIEETAVILLTNTKKSNRWKYLAVACILPFLFYSYWIPMETHYLDSGNIQMADFNPLQKKANKIYKTRVEKNDLVDVKFESNLVAKVSGLSSNVKFYNFQFSDELYIPVDLKSNRVKHSKPNAEVKPKVIKVKSKKIKHKFHLIAGCFGDEINANLLVEDLKSKGYNSTVVDKNKGLYRVAVQSFSTKKKAITFKSELNSSSISTWVLNK